MGRWGDDLFQSDRDLDIVFKLCCAAGLLELQDKDRVKDDIVDKDRENDLCYSIYSDYCSHPDRVRAHLDSGVLTKLIEAKQYFMLEPPTIVRWDSEDPCYVYVLLAACAMTLGCQLPESYIKVLKVVYTEGGLKLGALEQMKKALFGPDPYQNGVPYDFASKDLVETTRSKQPLPGASGAIGMNMIRVGPGGLILTGMRDSTSSPIIKELRQERNAPDTCGGCDEKQTSDGKALMRCARCCERRYCSVECQKKQWKVHKKTCGLLKQ